MKPTGFDILFWGASAERSGWKKLRAKQFLKEVDKRTETGSEDVLGLSKSGGVMKRSEMAQRASEAETYAGYKLVKRGQLISNKMQAWNGMFGISPYDGITSPDYAVYEFHQDVFPRFIEHLVTTPLYSAEFHCRSKGMGTGFLRLNPSEFLATHFWLPDLATQKQIADFLDAETARIDALIEKKQQVLAAVVDARFSTISRAVSVGLDADAPLVETGSPYLPKIPATWQIWRLKHLARVRGGLTLGRTVPDDIGLTSAPYLRVANVQAGWIDLSDVAEVDVTKAEIKRFSLQRGDVLMNEGGDNDKLGRGAVWQAPFEPCLNQNHVFCVRPNDLRYSDWISMTTNARYARDFFYLHSNQSTNLASISKTNVEKLPIAIPPPEEMRSVLNALNARLERFTVITEKVTHSIDRLREYRAALITAAVTGQIDVAAHARPVNDLPQRMTAEIIPLNPISQPTTQPDRRTVRVLIAAEVVHRLGNDPYLGRTKVQKLMFMAEAHANINGIAGCYERYRHGPYDSAMVKEIEASLRQESFYDAQVDATADRGKINFHRMARAGNHRDALSALLGDKVPGLCSLIDLFKDMDTEATEAVATLYAVWNDALIDGQQPDDAAIIRGFLHDWHPEKGKFRQVDLQNWLGWMRRHGIIPHGSGPRTVSTSTPGLFERD